jgi:ring-1,2-phenylacetyl-CoA epoxidase subunit PaaC
MKRMSNPNYITAVKELLYKMADDQLIIGHRNSEWTGIGPVLEEDIAFGSIAQDKVGHAYNIYQLLHEMGEADPDTIAFKRDERDFLCCHLVEMPIGEYDFSLVRHFLFDHSELIRFEMLTGSSFEPIANLAKKYKGEIKYHIFHANTWIKQLMQGTEESKARIQASFNEVFPLAFSIFEEGPFEDILKSEGVFGGEAALKTKWLETISSVCEANGIKLPEVTDKSLYMGGRKGFHTEFLKPMLLEMTEVLRLEPGAEW